jgi:hypothetical protein
LNPLLLHQLNILLLLLRRKKAVINSGFSMFGGADLGSRGFEPALLHQLNTSLFYSDEKTLNS